MQASTPRVRWLRPLGYEINVDEASTTITALLAEEIDKSAKIFGNYEMVKSKITMELQIASTHKKKDKLVKKLKSKFGEGEKEEEEKEEDEEKEQAQEPLAPIQGMREDKEEQEIEGSKEEEAEEEPTLAEPKKRKAKS